MLILSSTDFTNVYFFKNLFRNTLRVANGLNPELFAKVISRPQSVTLDLDPNFLTLMISLNLFFCKSRF